MRISIGANSDYLKLMYLVHRTAVLTAVILAITNGGKIASLQLHRAV